MPAESPTSRCGGFTNRRMAPDIGSSPPPRDRRGVLSSPMGDNTAIYPVDMSYAFKLLLEELRSLGIADKLRLEDRS